MPQLDRRLFLSLSLPCVLPWLTACSKDDPQAALEAAAQQLQDHLEAKDTGAVFDMLDPQFRAKDEFDRDWARKTMALMFLRYANVKVIAVTRSSRIDPPGSPIGVTEAQIVVTGAQGLIPERASPYTVQLRWQRDGDEWKLRDLQWE
ncbi:hypothetical protein ACVC7V_20345 [Hydrogenophaga sp. A37]|uniref:hypothetical protein n=1 Tax=Hydrogenophaga sp. A37 TaxID=1945864 RepID=UPI00098531E5|nr:hypothetical protein [Hydrogenophaga sp. A37]OOG82963.1 hypothetical protein B0E41_13560 [Hydrogenophaga sp. A37]